MSYSPMVRNAPEVSLCFSVGKEFWTSSRTFFRYSASARGLEVTKTGSGFNRKRNPRLKSLSGVNTGNMHLEHRDRLTEFGFEYMETLPEAAI